MNSQVLSLIHVTFKTFDLQTALWWYQIKKKIFEALKENGKKTKTLILRQNARKKIQHQPNSSKYKNLNILTEDIKCDIKKAKAV